MSGTPIFVPLSEKYTASVLEEREQFQYRLERAKRSLTEYGKLFTKLNVVIDQLKEKYAYCHPANDRDYEEMTSNPSEGTALTSPSSRSSSVEVTLKRKSSHIESGFFDSFEEEEGMVFGQYPKRTILNDNDDGATAVILGPNGTTLPANIFDEVVWQTGGAAVTRTLLALVFSNDILATHTLTGKPSPAFHGRERPPKMQLDAKMTADIIHCVRAKCGSNEREVRAAITTKCADTAKKYKRRLLRQAATQK